MAALADQHDNPGFDDDLIDARPVPDGWEHYTCPIDGQYPVGKSGFCPACEAGMQYERDARDRYDADVRDEAWAAGCDEDGRAYDGPDAF